MSSNRARAAAGRRDKRRPGNAQRVLAGDPSHSSARSIAPPPIVEGKARCIACRNVVSLTSKGVLRRHRDLFGQDCWNKRPEEGELSPFDAALVADILAEEKAAPVSFAPIAGDPGINERSPDGLCFECAKPIPPMRRLCGRCMSRRL